MKIDLGPTDDEEHIFECWKNKASHAHTYTYNVQR